VLKVGKRQVKRMKGTLAIGFLVVIGNCGLFASATERPALPANVVWLVDETDPAVLTAAFSATRGVSAALDHQRAIHAIVLNPVLREPTLNGILDPKRRAIVVTELDAAATPCTYETATQFTQVEPHRARVGIGTSIGL
jgi:hypothetical protein